MVEFVNCFEVPAGREDEFFDRWQVVNAYMSGRPGYVDHRLHRALRADARYQFVNVARWESVEAWQSAHDDRFRSLATGRGWEGITSTHALYEIVHQGSAAG